MHGGLARHRPLPFLLAALILAFLAVPPAFGDWAEPGPGPLDASATDVSVNPAIANVAGTPYATWAERIGAHLEIFVKRLEGRAWAQVGGSLNMDPTKDANMPVVADVGGVPYVAWSETNGTHELVFVKRFDGTNWVAVGNALNNSATADAFRPDITSIGGVPYVTWVESGATPNQVFVKRFIGNAWQSVGASLNVNPAASASDPHLASVGGAPYATWYEIDTHRFVYVKRFDGANWVSVGTNPLNLTATDDAEQPSIAAAGGVPYVAFQETNGGPSLIHVRALTGGDWATIGGALNVDQAKGATAPNLADVGGAPFVAFQQSTGTIDQIRAARFDGSAWRTVGGPLNVDPTKGASFLDPALTSVGGVPYALWEEAASATPLIINIRSKRLEPDITAETASPSATGAVLHAQVNDFGVPLPIGFEYGKIPNLGTEAPLQTTSGAGVSTVSGTITGLAPLTGYLFRAFGSDGSRQTSLGPTVGFSTVAPPADRIRALKISPAIFRAASRGPSVRAAARTGTVVSYVGSQAATTTFTVQRPSAGRRSGRRCVKAGKRNRKAKRCTRYVAVGSFTHRDVVGANRFRFSGRLHGRKLTPGRYRFRAVPRNVGGTGAPALKGFRVKR